MSAVLNPNPNLTQSGNTFLLQTFQTLYPRYLEPIVEFTWPRDVSIRADSNFLAKISSFRTRDFGVTGKGNSKIPYINSGETSWHTVTNEALQFDFPTYDIGWTIHFDRKEEMIINGAGEGDGMRIQEAAQLLNAKWTDATTNYNKVMDQVVYIGDTTAAKPYYGRFNQPSPFIDQEKVPPKTSGGTDTQWSGKDPGEILADILEPINDIQLKNNLPILRKVEVHLPISSMQILNRDMGGMGYKTIWSFIKENVAWDIDFYFNQWLEDAGEVVNGNPTKRMVVHVEYERNVDVMMHHVRPFAGRTIVQVGTTIYEQMAQVSPVQITNATMVRYRDGI